MTSDFKKENQGKKSRSYLLEPIINLRKIIVDHPQQEEEDEEVADVEDSAKAIKKKKKRRNHLTSQRLSARIVRRWVIFLTNVRQIRRRKAKRK